MIQGTHVIVYAEEAEETRRFFRKVLGWKSVDAGDGWLIFKMPPAEVGVHPVAPKESGTHELFLMCDDIRATVKALEKKGVAFVRPISRQPWGLITAFKLPGGGVMQIYEPLHPTAIGMKKKPAAKKTRRTAAKRRKR